MTSKPGHPVEIIAHRGASREAHENTLDAFASAIELDADRIETDVRRTRDGVLVLHHDPGPPGVTLGEIDSTDLPALADKFGYAIPTLAEVLEQFGDSIRWNIELKEWGYEDQVVDVVTRYLVPEQFVLTSFHDSVVRALRLRCPQLETGLILGDEAPNNWLLTRVSELYPMRRLAQTGASLFAVDHRFLRWGFLRNVRGFRGRVWLWTVNGGDRLRRLISMPGVDGIITDDVHQAVTLRDQIYAT